MRIRNKPPTLVSMWMLDVFCCALGCVTLLWLLNTREARENATRAGNALILLDETESKLNAKQAELLATLADLEQTRRQLNSEIEILNGRLLAMTTERDETAKKLASTQTELTTTTARSEELDDLLARKKKESLDLTAKLNTATTSAADLARLLRTREKERDELTLRAKAAADQLNDIDARLKSVMKEAKDATSSLAAMKKTGNELAAAQATIRNLQAKMDDANATIVDLQGDKAKLADKFNKLQSDSDTRFAGIVMTGKRVVFVVDTSGSMKLVNEKTESPQKWPIVVETLAKVMRTLPNLEKYQVVTFSRQAQYLFGSGEWQTYEGEASVKRVADTLRRLNPVGDTNMYDALDLTFRLRSDGLDTVYLFSDGLPTSGPGLTPDEMRLLSESAKSEKLTQNLRETLSTNWNRPLVGATDRPSRVKINSIGFFFESPEVGAFLWALSRDHEGSFVGMSRP